MKEITADTKLVGHCGLYCGACGSYLRDRCPGCHGNAKATWCTVRSCNIEHGFASCAQCTEFPNPLDCRKFNNLISKVMGFLFRSERAACIAQIKTLGMQGHAEDMAGHKRVRIKR